MSGGQLRTTRLFAIVGIAGLALGGIVVWQVLGNALDESGVRSAAAARIRGDVLLALFSLGVIMLGVVIVAGRAYAHKLNELREVALARARGDHDVPAPEFAVRELSDIMRSLERLSAHVSSREAHVARENAEVAVLLDAISEGILQIDRAGRIVRANPAARALLGLTQRAVGQPGAAHIRHAGLRHILERAAGGSDVPAAEIALEGRRIIVTARPLHATSSSGGGSVIAFVDLTEVRRLEGVRRDFVANVSHELKTPLTSIRGYVETLLGDEDMPAAVRRQFMEVVHRNADRLHHIVDDLLDLSRLESGGWRPELHEVNAVDVIEDVWASCSESAQGRHVSFVAPAMPVAVCADPGGLRQVLSNLLDNAVRYTPDGGRIEVRAIAASVNGDGRARPADMAPNGYVTFEVSDTGMGIPSDELPRIFERFYRVDTARSRAEGGTGLGLSIVRHLVESMGGDVSAESELGKGTTIRFRLPAAR